MVRSANTPNVSAVRSARTLCRIGRINRQMLRPDERGHLEREPGAPGNGVQAARQTPPSGGLLQVLICQNESVAAALARYAPKLVHRAAALTEGAAAKQGIAETGQPFYIRSPGQDTVDPVCAQRLAMGDQVRLQGGAAGFRRADMNDQLSH